MQTRRSARAVPSKRKSLAEPESDEWHSEEEDGDFDGHSRATKSGLAKRRRTNTAAKSKSTKPTETKRKKNGKKRRDLSLLPTMPLDILFTICATLAPGDLVSLSRVDSNFCRTLTAKNVSFVWKAVREAEGGIEPPQGIPEYRWVDLLFGKSVCDICHGIFRRNASVNWTLRRRVCTFCSKKNLISASRVRRRFPDVNADFLSLVPLTDAGPGHMCARRGYYWISDIADVEAKIKELEADLGSSERLAEFRTERKKLVEDMTKGAWKYEEWIHSNARKKAGESQRRIDERFSMIRARLLALGYTERDVNGIRWESSVTRDAELTSQGWNRTRPGLEAAINVNRIEQAKEDRSVALNSRAKIVEGIIKTYKQQFLPVVWREMPLFIDICTFLPFRGILELPTDIVVTEASFADAMNELPNLTANWQRQRESELRALVPPQETGNVDPLKLATTTFSCKHGCRAIITSADIWRHTCATYPSYALGSVCYGQVRNVDDLYHNLGNTEPSFDMASSAVAESLVRLASRDPATTTAEEMDSLNVEFLDERIRTYTLTDKTGSCRGRRVLSWRECVQGDTVHGRGSDVYLLTPGDEVKKRSVVREEYRLSWISRLFHCQHCSGHLDPQTYEDVTAHLKDVHAVDDPLMDRDLFLTPGEDMPAAQRPPLYIVESERDPLTKSLLQWRHTVLTHSTPYS
ncbi:hypothetical protein ARMSODRAFT_953812 [Armillaria solidipes]|uniref:F-box domain-containing protein n=1 Tax=Armillaria solidipes TaxID=1076256 RepID=A0A2H3C7M7_9AGAR|nr:hypothetical protein ARMSODRAFT_953812 [Armillaria solidipes]